MQLSRLFSIVAAAGSMAAALVSPAVAARHHAAKHHGARPAAHRAVTHHKAGASHTKRAAAPATQKTAAAPAAYRCIHCGRPIKLASAAELTSTCRVCGCHKTNSDCMPKK